MSLHYTFPRPEAMKLRSTEVTREVQINKNLEFQSSSVSPANHISREPYVKSFSCSNPNTPESLIISSIDDPIDDIFQESRRQISSYKIQLPGKEGSLQESTLKADAKRNSLESSLRDTKNSFQIHNDPEYKEHSIQSTPVRNGSNPKTPVQKEFSQKSSFSEDSSLDPLACHADNIMRMAMDSTMAHSFSSNFSNLVDETQLEKIRRFPGFNERAIVEISAADLENAVNDPFRL